MWFSYLNVQNNSRYAIKINQYSIWHNAIVFLQKVKITDTHHFNHEHTKNISLAS